MGEEIQVKKRGRGCFGGFRVWERRNFGAAAMRGGHSCGRFGREIMKEDSMMFAV